MPLESILSRILDASQLERDRIMNEARLEAEEMIKEAEEEAEKLYQERIDREKAVYMREKEKLIVNARLEGKKNILNAKQESIDRVFYNVKAKLAKAAFKKQLIREEGVEELSAEIDFYLNRARLDYETEIAKMLFK